MNKNPHSSGMPDPATAIAGRAQAIARRQAAMAVLARAEAGELADLADRVAARPFIVLKPAETGTIMVEGRAGGSGQRFNLGEATMTRCVIRLESGTMGYSFALGRDRDKAQAAALIEAALQEEAPGGPLQAAVAAIAARQAAARDLASRKAAATKVEFFTLVRGEG